MTRIIEIPLEAVAPQEVKVYLLQGIPEGAQPHERVRKLYREAEVLFLETARPRAIIAQVSAAQFAEIYPGEGNNEPQSPLPLIYPQAFHLALFAGTVGAEVSENVESLMKSGSTNFALGFMLDTIASYSTDRIAEAAERIVHEEIAHKHDGPLKVLNYSPGYCGWHISGQGKLFQALKPESIGITLTDNYLMLPIKSVSGVLAAHTPAGHDFDNSYPFCDQCRTFNCRERIRFDIRNSPLQPKGKNH